MPAPELFAAFIHGLNQLGVPYMITGAVAAIIYGEPRLTHDIDVVLALDPADAARISTAFPTVDFYAPAVETIATEASRDAHGHINLLHLETGMKADIYMAGSDPLHRWAFARRRRESFGDEVIWVAPIEYVIVRKLEYFREGGSDRHLRDIRQMLRVSCQLVDHAALAGLLEAAGVQREWEEVERSGTR